MNATIVTKCQPGECPRDVCEDLCKKLNNDTPIIACEHIKKSDWSIGDDCVAIHGDVPEIKPSSDTSITECQCAIIGTNYFRQLS